MSKFTSDDAVARWFAYQPPTTDVVKDAHEQIRAGYGELAQQMNNLLPEGPDKTVALRALREAMWHANATVACAQDVYVEQTVRGGGLVASAAEMSIPEHQRIGAPIHIEGLGQDDWAAAQRRGHIEAAHRLRIERNSGEIIG